MAKASKTNTVQPIAFSPRAASEAIGVGPTKIYAEIAAGRIKARKLGRRTLILREDLMAYLASLPITTGGEAA